MTVSPCIRLCVIEPGAGLCSGCGRTLAEIAAWGSMAEAERLRIMAELPRRLAAPLPDASPMTAGAGPG
jgi:predicted Fe-S protein YdhL (DUF1289 family)